MTAYRNKEDGTERNLPPFWMVHGVIGAAFALAFAMIASGDGILPAAGGWLFFLCLCGYCVGVDPNDRRTVPVAMWGGGIMLVSGFCMIAFATDRHVWLAGAAMVGACIFVAFAAQLGGRLTREPPAGPPSRESEAGL